MRRDVPTALRVSREAAAPVHRVCPLTELSNEILPSCIGSSKTGHLHHQLHRDAAHDERKASGVHLEPDDTLGRVGGFLERANDDVEESAVGEGASHAVHPDKVARVVHGKTSWTRRACPMMRG